MKLKDIDKLIKQKKKEFGDLENAIGTLKNKKPVLQKEISELTDKKIGIKDFLKKKEEDLMAVVEKRAAEVEESLKVASEDREKAKQLRKDGQALYDKAEAETNTALSGSAKAEGDKAEVNAKIGRIVSFAETLRKFADSIK
ncbi:hypothetical protein LCGC14_1312840 [marine sediment metagenome]|uniref:Uncharacterized protein n=1 Tax=marine sediment metagenome TaxID=412755 RepID=A0A0F9KLQ0_9ZZZZ